MIRKFTAVYMKHGKKYIGYIDQSVSVNASAPTLNEAKKKLKEALKRALKEDKYLGTLRKTRVESISCVVK